MGIRHRGERGFRVKRPPRPKTRSLTPHKPRGFGMTKCVAGEVNSDGYPSGSHAPIEKVILRGDAKSVRHAIEEREQSDHVNGFRDLVFAPACIAEFLDVGCGGLGSRLGNQLGVIEQRALGRSQPCFIELAFENCLNALVGCSLNTQEVGVAVESIRAPIQERDVTRKHLLVTPGEMTLRKMYGVRKFHHLAQEVWPRAEALDDSGNLIPSGAFAPEIISRSSVAGGFVILGNADLCGRSFGRWFGGLFRLARLVFFFVASHMRQTSLDFQFTRFCDGKGCRPARPPRRRCCQREPRAGCESPAERAAPR